MNVAIFSVEPASQILANIIEEQYNTWLKMRLGEPMNVAAFVATDLDSPIHIGDFAVLHPLQLLALYHKKIIDKIIFPRGIQSELIRYFVIEFTRLNVKLEDIYLTADLSDGKISAADLLEPYTSAKYLPYLEFQIADHCNLNCKGCTHYSPLVKKPTFPSLEKMTQDFELLHKFVDDIGKIRIMGGEPLLNPQVNEYVKLVRRIYPKTDLRLVTNAILIPKMDEKFFETLRAYNVTVDISIYPPMRNKIQDILNSLEKKNIPVSINGADVIEEFFRYNTLKKHNRGAEIFRQCDDVRCNFLQDGKISVCPATATTKYFNAYYGKNLPQDGMIDLYEEGLTTEKIKTLLLTPFERCNYCVEKRFLKWETVTYPSPIDDWLAD